MSADLGALSERHERRQSFELGTSVPAQRAAVAWSPPSPCEAQRAPLEECGHVGDVELTLTIRDDSCDGCTVDCGACKGGLPYRVIVVCAQHRHAAEVVLLAHVPRNRVVTLTLRPIDTVRGL